MMLRFLIPLIFVTGPLLAGPAQASRLLPGQIHRIDRILENLVEADSPGCAVAVLREGRLVYRRELGLANLEHRVPITPHTTFNLASTSKQFTAFTVLMLARDGLLTLQDDIRKYLPDIPAYERPIRIRHLLHHTSGIRDYSIVQQYAGLRMYKDYLGPDEVLRTIVRQEGLAFPPGDRFEYSNSNYWLLAEIVHRVTGSDFGKVLEERVFRPLGMHRSWLQDDLDALIPGRAGGYAPGSGGGYRRREDSFPSIGDGGIFTTLDDLAAWAAYLESPPAVDEALVAAMVAPGTLDGGQEVPYGGGLELSEHRGRSIVSHAGFTAGYRAELLRVPGEALAVLVLANLRTIRPDHLALEIADLLLEARPPVEEPPAAASPEVERPSGEDATEAASREGILGTYYRPGGSIFEFFVRARAIVGRVNGGGDFQLERAGAAAFRITDSPGETFRFIPGMEGRASEFEYRRSAKARPSQYRRVEPLPAEVAVGYAGRYWSGDLGVVYEVRADDGLLSLQVVETGRRLGPLVRREGEVFTDGGAGAYRFERGADGRVVALVLEVARMGRLRMPRQASGPAARVPRR